MNNTLIKGLALLEVVARAQRPLGVTELAAQLGIAKSHAHRLLQGLVELKYVQHDPATRGYAASVRLWELGSSVLEGLDLRRIAQPYMEALLEQTRETVHLSVLDGAEVVYVHKIESHEPVRAYSQIGGRAPAHCVATGKALLAWLGAARLADLASGIERYTPRTIVEEAAFLREMDRVRKQGYAVNRGEWRESVGGIGAPIRDIQGHVIAAVGISGPIARIKPSMFKALAGPVVAAAQCISVGLGANPLANQQLWNT
jgi:DNA-binding IclR family transcriptional regulator